MEIEEYITKKLKKQIEEKKEQKANKEQVNNCMQQKLKDIFDTLDEENIEQEELIKKIKDELLKSTSFNLKLKKILIKNNLNNIEDETTTDKNIDYLIKKNLLCDETISRILKNLNSLQQGTTIEEPKNIEQLVNIGLQEKTNLKNEYKQDLLDIILKNL